ncbi:MAG: APC family permease [Armatimonadetes bacterium]|nr:APC family permease [Armatimonadota bacterium]
MKPAAKIGLLPLAATVFFAVSGGPIGLEPLVQASGLPVAVALILLAPLLYAIPSALMTAELSTMIPEEGGYFVWVSEAMGPFWGFLCGMWTLMYAWVDAALYPLMAAKALAAFAAGPMFSGQSWASQIQQPGPQFGVAVVFVLAAALLNLAGIRAVGLTGVTIGVLLLVPFVMMVVWGFSNAPGSGQPVFLQPEKPTSELVMAGLVTVIWNYLGWDSASTIAGETKDPRRDFPRALLGATVLIVLAYLLPVLAAWRHAPDYRLWEDGSWVTLAGRVGGPNLGTAMFVSQLLSAAGLFMVMLLTSSRLPMVMARTRRLPAVLAKTFGVNKVPVPAVVLGAAVVTSFVWQGEGKIEKIMQYDVLLYTAALMLEFIALVVLRVRRPEEARPFRVPGGLVGAVLLGVGPAVVMVLLCADGMGGKGAKEFAIAVGLLALAPAVYGLTEWYRRRVRPTP